MRQAAGRAHLGQFILNGLRGLYGKKTCREERTNMRMKQLVLQESSPSPARTTSKSAVLQVLPAGLWLRAFAFKEPKRNLTAFWLKVYALPWPNFVG